MIKLFSQLAKEEFFHFGDKPHRLLIKADRDHYVAPEGRRYIHPHVAVFPIKIKLNRQKSIFDQSQGDSDGR